MKLAMEAKEVICLDKIDKFVDGAAVKSVGNKTFDICQELMDDILLVPEEKVCTSILELYNEHAIVAEPAGAMPIAALDLYREEIKGKNVVCVVSGEIMILEECRRLKRNHFCMRDYYTTLSLIFLRGLELSENSLTKY